MKIIALVGAQNVGKTATLLELISIVKKAGGSEIESSIKYVVERCLTIRDIVLELPQRAILETSRR